MTYICVLIVSRDVPLEKRTAQLGNVMADIDFAVCCALFAHQQLTFTQALLAHFRQVQQKHVQMAKPTRIGYDEEKDA